MSGLRESATPGVGVGRQQARDPLGCLLVVVGLAKRGVGILDRIEALAGRTAGRHERDEGLGGAADEFIGVVVRSYG